MRNTRYRTVSAEYIEALENLVEVVERSINEDNIHNCFNGKVLVQEAVARVIAERQK